MATERSDTERVSPTPMTEEEKSWLKEAMGSLIVDGATLVKRYIDALQLSELSDAEKTGLLESLFDLVENIDNANALLRTKHGLSTIIKHTKHSYCDSIRINSMRVLAAVVDTNPEAQGVAVGCGILADLFGITGPSLKDQSPGVQSAIVKLLSALFRNRSSAFLYIAQVKAGCDSPIRSLEAAAATLRYREKTKIDETKNIIEHSISLIERFSLPDIISNLIELVLSSPENISLLRRVLHFVVSMFDNTVLGYSEGLGKAELFPMVVNPRLEGLIFPLITHCMDMKEEDIIEMAKELDGGYQDFIDLRKSVEKYMK
ncbi:hypothetical protein ADUPG1_006218 [Aduncisulcus paluster]|uniref:Nucleotide exchange factor Fes1 domain-containing protein n=1 Tax=Aduncisulcus paluster TaxID=2918883 RepID=A0ABQ5KKB3_9EUKA|nr:hypothetical protein ADUPG1_006218 [Aduncisulcus paluster]